MDKDSGGRPGKRRIQGGGVRYCGYEFWINDKFNDPPKEYTDTHQISSFVNSFSARVARCMIPVDMAKILEAFWFRHLVKQYGWQESLICKLYLRGVNWWKSPNLQPLYNHSDIHNSTGSGLM